MVYGPDQFTFTAGQIFVLQAVHRNLGRNSGALQRMSPPKALWQGHFCHEAVGAQLEIFKHILL